MKRAIHTLLTLLLAVGFAYGQDAPMWVTHRPTADDAYIGISSIETSAENYRDKARMAALNDMAAQIKVNIASESFMQTVDMDGAIKQTFDQKINESISADLKGYKMVGSYEGGGRYYVYYSLTHKAYNDYIESERKNATQVGLDLLTKGLELEQQGELLAALELYIKGLESVEPYMHLKLDGMFNGRYVNVANELYTAYRAIFTGMALTTSVTEMEVESLKASGQPIAVCLSKNGVVIPNMPISAHFAMGSGEVTPMAKSDYTGTAIFYVTNITSKGEIQRLHVSIDNSFFEKVPLLYRQLLGQSNLPQVEVTLVVKNTARTAFFSIKENAIPQCESQVRSIFAGNHFTVTEDRGADILIEYSTTFKKGNQVDTGGVYPMIEYYCSMNVKIYDNQTSALLAEYTTPMLRVLSANNRTEDQARMSCARDLMKQFQRGLPNTLKSIKF